jgi:hypothetical protein
MAIPVALFMLLAIAGVTAILASVSHQNLREMSVSQDTHETYIVAEGALNRMMSELASFGPLWDKQGSLQNKPLNYIEFAPSAFTSTNGIPNCSGVACHRNYYPVGGGLIKNFGPLVSDGLLVNAAVVVSEQLDFEAPPTPDIILAGMDAWSQVERLDETYPTVENLGGNLSSSLAEGGNAKNIRFRLTGVAQKVLRDELGSSTVIAIVELHSS